MRFDEAIQHPIGTIIRRASWPLHWWVTIVPRGIPLNDTSRVALSYTAIGQTTHPGSLVAIRGETATVCNIDIDDARADDWTASKDPPIDVEDTNDDPACVLIVDGKPIPLASCPSPDARYRVVPTLVPIGGRS